MKDYHAYLEPESVYHIYNRAHGAEYLFLNDGNYRFFLQGYRQYISPIADTFCYCLMPNHFHLMLRIKSRKEVTSFFESKDRNIREASSENPANLEKLLSKQFSNWLNSYAKAFNKQQQRVGGLFMRPTKRIKVKDHRQFTKLIHYIHFNPVKAGLCSSIEAWEFSSYNSILSKSPSIIDSGEVLEWFDGVQNFLHVHQYPPELTGIHEIES